MKKSVFLITTYVRTPTDKQGNRRYDEIVGFTHKIRNSDLKSCHVIIDLVNKSVVKCSISEDNETFGCKSFEDIYKYFQTHYPEAIQSVETAIAKSNTITI